MKDRFIILANVVASAIALSPHPSHPDAGWADHTILAYAENTFDHRPMAPAGWEDFTLEEPEVVAPAGWEDFSLPDVSFDFEGSSKAAGAQCILPNEALIDPNFTYDGLCTAQSPANSPPAGWQDFSTVAISSESSTLAGVEHPHVSPIQPETQDERNEPSLINPQTPSEVEGSVLDEQLSDVFDDSILSREYQEEELLKRVLLTVESSPFTKHNTSHDENATHDVPTSWTQTPILSLFDPSDFQDDGSPLVSFWRKVVHPLLSFASSAFSSVELPYQDEMTHTIQLGLESVAVHIASARSGVEVIDIIVTVLETVFIALISFGSKLRLFHSRVWGYVLFVAIAILGCIISIRSCSRRRSYKLRRQQQSFLAKQRVQPILRKEIPRRPSSRHWYERADGYHGMCAV